MTETAIKGTMFRLRPRYREIFRAEIARTLANPDDLESEIRHLFAVVSQ